MSSKKVSLVVPVFNEKGNLDAFLAALSPVLARLAYDHEIIFVDDGSQDESFDWIRKAAVGNPNIKALCLSRNFGSHGAITAGLKYCQGDAAIIMSVDLQDPPELLPEFIREWEKGFQVVWGRRRKRDDSLGKRLTSFLFNRLLRSAALLDCASTGSFCLIDRQVREVLNQLPESNRVTFALIAWAGFKQAGVSYDRPERLNGKSKWSYGRMVKTALDVLTTHTYLPLRLISFMGCASLLVSMAIIAYVLQHWYFYRRVEPGWSTLMISIFGLGGVQMLSLGVIGEYLWRISEDVKHRPNFVVKDLAGF